MKLVYRCIAILIVIASSSQLSAQVVNTGKLDGLIVDKKSKEPLRGARIQIVESDAGRISDTVGSFSFESLKVGRYTLKVSYIGHITAIVPNQSILQGKTLHTVIELEEDIRTLSAVEVTSYRYENDITKPISTYSFSRDEISLNPGSQGDIFRAIGMLPGVTSSGGVYSAIAVRGQGVRDNVYLVDDIPLTEVGHLEGNSFFNDPNGGRFSIFAPRVIDNAIFQGGAFSSEYGRRSASYLGLSIKEGNKGSAIYDGQIDLLGVTFNYDGPSLFSENTTIFLSARYQNFYPLVQLVGLQNLGLPIYGDIILKSTTEIDQMNKLNVLIMVCPESFVRDMDNVYADKDLNLLYLPDFKRNKIVTGINLRTLIGSQSVWKNILYFTNYSSVINVGKAYPHPDSLGNIPTEVYDFNASIQTQNYSENKWGFRSLFETSFFNNDRVVFGIEGDIVQLKNDRILIINDTNFVFRREQLIDPSKNYQVVTSDLVNANINSSASNASAFANYFFEFGSHISGQAGLRLDYSGFSEQAVVSPRANISYHINTNHSVSFGTGLFYQDPVYSDIADLPEGIILEMEKVTQYIVSYKGYLQEDLKIMFEAWYKTFDNMVVTPILGSVYRNNNGSGYGKGLDLSITKRLSEKWHGIASYSYMEVLRNDNDGLGEYNFSYSQPHQFNIMFSYQLDEQFSFSGKYRFAIGRPTDAYIIYEDVLNYPDYYLYGMELIGRNKNRLPNFSSLDLRINYMFNFKTIKFTAFFDVVNVLNRQIANSESFNYIHGYTYYDGLAIFPTGGLKFEF